MYQGLLEVTVQALVSAGITGLPSKAQVNAARTEATYPREHPYNSPSRQPPAEGTTSEAAAGQSGETYLLIMPEGTWL